MQIREFRPGDGPALVQAWRRAMPLDPITDTRFRDLVLLDANFDPDGLRIALDGDRLVGAAYAVRRRVAMVAGDLEPGTGWLPFFFVTPEARGAGVGRALVRGVLDWLRGQGAREVFFASYTPNYVLPGLDAEAYPEAAALLRGLGFERRSEAAAMDRSLVGHRMPDEIRARVDDLTAGGYRFGTPTGDDLVELLRLAGEEFNPDWARAIRDAVVAGLPPDRIVGAWEPGGTLAGWAMHAAYENVLERFGPFGVRPDRRGTGLGRILLQLTLERMRAAGAHSAWFLWTGERSAAGQLYRSTGFAVTRRFAVLRAELT
ncbi:Acetyltransferase (GNAT) family protein [Actinopolymorpha cephalotaxi]|uniref:Acetyltransferase (GNAT) family protein n=1 Tax=Actinopolymorpha cephalotaxi TaxID=504797 RepID=A0A1I2ND10_9ACTN|nr:GNAT family N-acetyltransferase [Actinopolymorpha cephalotaxi]NYH85605.1 GNAT superfamily N-acetyltransferase [Actinopolymorpha cephalotaxi]SFG00960.1 Acetyltransferase (GNAT) family protein [Actinopolymorpha cephalotaxi]